MSALLKAASATTLRTLAVMLVVVALVALVAVTQFKLTIIGAIALYFVVWWTLLFAVLPLRNEAETNPALIVPGQDRGAPAAPRLREKAVLTTLLASVVFLAAIPVFGLAGL